jgi:hypothetical protein
MLTSVSLLIGLSGDYFPAHVNPPMFVTRVQSVLLDARTEALVITAWHIVGLRMVKERSYEYA